MFKQINHSFAAKLNIYLISSAFLLWGIGFCLFYHYSSRAIEHQAYLKIDESAEKINLKVTRLLRTIEKIPENLSWIIPSYVTHADSIYAITRQVVLNNYEIFGCAITVFIGFDRVDQLGQPIQREVDRKNTDYIILGVPERYRIGGGQNIVGRKLVVRTTPAGDIPFF